MQMHRKKLLGAVVAACAVVGASAGIAQSSTGKGKAHASGSTQPPGLRPGGHGPMDGDRDAVHSVSVVPDQAGTAFVTQTTDRGTIESVDAGAGSITILEGTKTATYGTPKLTIPSDATIVLDGKKSSLSSLAEGDRVTVSSSSEGTTVFAADSSFHPRGPGFGLGGPGGPPPGAPGGY